MYVAIRQYGLLTNEPVEKVMQGIREGFIPKGRTSWPRIG